MADHRVDGEATGVALPFAPSQTGGVRLLRGDELISQYVKTYVADWDNDNPYNDDGGLGLEAVYAISGDTAWKGVVRRRVETLFNRYLERSNLARLRSISFSKTREGEDEMNVVFISIESNEELALSIPVSAERGQ